MSGPLPLVIVKGVIPMSRGRRAGLRLSNTEPSSESQIRRVTNMLDVQTE
jgi:hypothetical protein